MSESPRLDVRHRHTVAWPKVSQVFRNPSLLIAFGFGAGLLRPGSGTWGSLLAALLWPFLLAWVPSAMLGIFIALAFALGCIACDRAGRLLGIDDHVGMVWDEMVAVWLLLWALPDDWGIVVAAVILFRLFDVAKPFPIRSIDASVKGGLGVMVDDLVAALYAWVLVMGWIRYVWPYFESTV